MRPAWITWQVHRRTREIARAMGFALHELLPDRAGPGKYPSLVGRTLRVLRRRRPTHLIVQCPSVVLGVLAATLRPLLGFRLIADLHNEAVQPFNYSGAAYLAAIRRIHRSADLGLVTNAGLETTVENNGGHPFVLPDRIPCLTPALRELNDRRVTFVCTYAPDEPWREVLKASSLLPPGTTVAVTGRPPREAELLAGSRVHLTGFLDDDNYVDLLASSAVIMDLTAMPDCLVCGGYEAVALGRPLVTSDTAALRSYFRRGTVYTSHAPVALAAAVEHALGRRSELERQVPVLASELRSDWDARASTLARLLEEM